MTGGQAVLTSVKGCIYSPSTASKEAERQSVHSKYRVQCRQLPFIINRECFLNVFSLRAVKVVLGGACDR